MSRISTRKSNEQAWEDLSLRNRLADCQIVNRFSNLRASMLQVSYVNAREILTRGTRYSARAKLIRRNGEDRIIEDNTLVGGTSGYDSLYKPGMCARRIPGDQWQCHSNITNDWLFPIRKV